MKERCRFIEEFAGHKLTDNGYYIIRGNLIDLKNIYSIEPEYHNNKRSIYIKIHTRTGGKNIIKLFGKSEYNFIVRRFNELLNTTFEEI